jgi:hypothetical protein
VCTYLLQTLAKGVLKPSPTDPELAALRSGTYYCVSSFRLFTLTPGNHRLEQSYSVMPCISPVAVSCCAIRTSAPFAWSRYRIKARRPVLKLRPRSVVWVYLGGMTLSYTKLYLCGQAIDATWRAYVRRYSDHRGIRIILFGSPIGSKVLKNSVTADVVLWRGEQWRSASHCHIPGSLLPLRP